MQLYTAFKTGDAEVSALEFMRHEEQPETSFEDDMRKRHKK